MDPQLALAFWAMNLMLSVTPGPAVLQVAGAAVAQGPLRAQASIAGIALGNAIYIALSALGLGALFAAWPASLAAVRWLGAAYVAWLGIGALRAAWRGARSGESGQDLAPARARSPRRLFTDALVVQLSNPKSVLFFGALLPQFVAPQGWPALAQMLVLGGVAIALEWPILAGYAWFVQRGARRFGDHWVPAASGGLLLGAAAWMAAG